MLSSCKRVLHDNALHNLILSYVLDPLIMTMLCAVAQHWQRRCFDEASWLDNVVDVPPWYKPSGVVAWNHFQSWTFAKYVVTRPWMFRYCGLLMDLSVQPWQWSRPRPGLHDISVVRPVRALTDLKDMMWRRFRGNWFQIGTPAPICDIRVRLQVDKEPVPNFCFGFANTKDVFELTTLITNAYSPCGLLGRDPGPTDFGQLNYYYCAIRGDFASFYLNSRKLREAPCPQMHGSVIIKFGVVDSKLLFGFYDWLFEISLSAESVCAEDYHFPVLFIDGSEGSQDSVCFPLVEPLLSKKGAMKR